MNPNALLPHLNSLLLRCTVTAVAMVGSAHFGMAFEGRITATTRQGTEFNALIYTIAEQELRIERSETNWPYARNLVNLESGERILMYPHNRGFLRLKPASRNATSSPPGVPMLPNALPPGMGPQSSLPSQTSAPSFPNLPPGMGPQSGPTASGVAALPAMPMRAMAMMPPPMATKLELNATGETTNILGFACARYTLSQQGQTIEIWATDKLFAFQPYLQTQPSTFRSAAIEEQWPALLTERKLFPLMVSLRYDNGHEVFRFEVSSVKAEKIAADGDLFRPPSDYHELQPLPF